MEGVTGAGDRTPCPGAVLTHELARGGASIGHMSEDVDELAAVLFRLDFEGISTADGTTLITRTIVGWALRHGWPVRTEARVGLPISATAKSRLGYIDAIVRRGNGRPDLAIEIDSTDKEWSLAKLRHASAAGLDAIWIRWGDDDWAGAYDGVDVIQLPARRREARRASPGPITLWS